MNNPIQQSNSSGSLGSLGSLGNLAQQSGSLVQKSGIPLFPPWMEGEVPTFDLDGTLAGEWQSTITRIGMTEVFNSIYKDGEVTIVDIIVGSGRQTDLYNATALAQVINGTWAWITRSATTVGHKKNMTTNEIRTVPVRFFDIEIANGRHGDITQNVTTPAWISEIGFIAQRQRMDEDGNVIEVIGDPFLLAIAQMGIDDPLNTYIIPPDTPGIPNQFFPVTIGLLLTTWEDARIRVQFDLGGFITRASLFQILDNMGLPGRPTFTLSLSTTSNLNRATINLPQSAPTATTVVVTIAAPTGYAFVATLGSVLIFTSTTPIGTFGHSFVISADRTFAQANILIPNVNSTLHVDLTADAFSGTEPFEPSLPAMNRNRFLIPSGDINSYEMNYSSVSTPTPLRYLETDFGMGIEDRDSLNRPIVTPASLAGAEIAFHIESIALDDGRVITVDYLNDLLQQLGLPPVLPIDPVEIRTYGVQIDYNNSNPYTSVTYINDAMGMMGGSASWDDMPIFRDIKPCLFRDGTVIGYLNPNNYAEWAPGQGLSGTPDITSGAGGDVMVEFPKVGWRIVTEGNILTVQVTNDPNAGSLGYRYYAHTRVVEGDRGYLYVGVYKGHVLNNRLRSLSGRMPSALVTDPTGPGTISDFRSVAHANGAGYEQQMFYSLMLLQVLYLIRFKNLNSQAALGQGLTASTTHANTGGTNARGMNWGTQNGEVDQVKCLGVEDLWGNMWERVDGCFSDANTNLLTAFQNFNDNGSGYTNRGFLGQTPIGQHWITRVHGNSEAGFINREGGGSMTTFFSDEGGVLPSRLGASSGHRYNGGNAGIFMFALTFEAAHEYFRMGARLTFL